MIDDPTDNIEAVTSTDDEGKGKGKSGSGKATGSGSAGGIRLPIEKLKQVTEALQHLDATQAVARLAEFFSELPAKASAQISVKWVDLVNKVGSAFTIVSDVLRFGQQVHSLRLNPTRENMERLRTEFGLVVR